MRNLCSGLFFLISTCSWSQTNFIGGFGNNWENSANWQAGNIGDDITKDVTLNSGQSALINNGFNYTIGDLIFENGATLSINSTGSLNVGQSGTPKNVTANNTATINVTGTLVIWGNLIVNTNLTFNITGSVVIRGNIVMNDGARLFATGNLNVDGNFTGGDDTDVTILGSGLINVSGVVSVGNESQLTGPPGSFTTSGCTQGSTNSTFCNSSALPVTLIFFKAVLSQKSISLKWATASEINFDHFELEKSFDGITFFKLTAVQGNGTTNVRHDYDANDSQPSIGMNYYRLKSIDFDGYTETFETTVVEFTGEKSLTVYPNPSNGEEVRVFLNFNPSEESQITVLDSFGKEVIRQSVISSDMSLLVNSNLMSGIYFARVNSSSFSQTIRFVIN
jgi:hypothetical protein